MTRVEQVLAALKAVSDAIYDTVKEEPLGAPSGAVYAALMHFGISLDTYNAIITSMVRAGRIRQAGNLLFAI